jgi:hypothetical protein
MHEKPQKVSNCGIGIYLSQIHATTDTTGDSE